MEENDSPDAPDRPDQLTPTDEAGEVARQRERIKRRLFEPNQDTLLDESAEFEDDEAALPLDSLIGKLIATETDPHRSEAVLARGGMGIIERVHDRRLKRMAAMKIVRQRLTDSPWAARAFIVEAQLTAQLEHPNIVPVHALGQLEDGRLYFTMKHITGQTLGQIIKSMPQGPLPRRKLFELLEIIVKVCDALALAHSKGVFHCDIKPGNVMVGSYGEVYLMDWGIARVTRPETTEGVSTSVDYEHGTKPFGTAAYMPPEQARGLPSQVDARTDVFGVGCLLYAVLTRRRPYTQRGLIALVRAAAEARFTPVGDLVPPGSVPRELQRIVAKAMALEKGDRFASATELRDALVAFMHGEQSFPRQSYAAGQTIVAEGEPGSTGYIIESGRCEVSRTVDGQKTVLRTMNPGDVFGETAVLTEAARTATVTALEDTVVHVVSRDAFDDALAAMSPWMAAYVRTLADRFRDRETSG